MKISPLWKVTSETAHWQDAQQDQHATQLPQAAAPAPPSNCQLRSVRQNVWQIQSGKSYTGMRWMILFLNRNLPLLLLTFLRCPPYHPHRHHHHPRPQAGQTQPLFANISATICMLLDTHHFHSELMKINERIGHDDYIFRYSFQDSENIINNLLGFYPLPCRKIWHFWTWGGSQQLVAPHQNNLQTLVYTEFLSYQLAGRPHHNNLADFWKEKNKDH